MDVPEVRSGPEFDAWIKWAYVDQNLSTVEIGRMLGWYPSTVNRRLRKLGVAFRPNGYADMFLVEGMEDYIRNAFVVEGKSRPVIAEKIGCTVPQLDSALRHFGISSNERSKLWKVPGIRNVLYEKFIVQSMSKEAIANELGCSIHEVRHALERFGIFREQTCGINTLATDEENAPALRRLYLDERRPIAEIAEMYGCTTRQVSYAIKKFGIPTRPDRYVPRPVSRGGGYVGTYRNVDGMKVLAAQHRIVLENFLGFELPADWIVHHVDKNRSHNDLLNLVGIHSCSHTWLHRVDEAVRGIINRFLAGRDISVFPRSEIPPDCGYAVGAWERTSVHEALSDAFGHRIPDSCMVWSVKHDLAGWTVEDLVVGSREAAVSILLVDWMRDSLLQFLRNERCDSKGIAHVPLQPSGPDFNAWMQERVVEDGLRAEDIAWLVGLRKSSVITYLNDLGVSLDSRPLCQQGIRDRVRTMVEVDHMTGKEIAKELGLPTSTVYGFMRRHGIRCGTRLSSCPELQDKIRTMVEVDHKSSAAIAKELDLPASTVYAFIRRQGIRCKEDMGCGITCSQD